MISFTYTVKNSVRRENFLPENIFTVSNVSLMAFKVVTVWNMLQLPFSLHL